MKKNEVYRNYLRAMEKRRPGVALDHESFFRYIDRWDVVERGLGKSRLYGVEQSGIFFPTHFAPAGLKEGIDLIKQVKDELTCFVVTPDLGAMLAKLGYKKLGKCASFFREKRVDKVVYISSFRVLLTFVLGEAREVMHRVRWSLDPVLRPFYCASYKVQEVVCGREFIDENSMYD